MGALQYLTFIRPNIAYDVHHVAQFISAPRSPRLIVAKCIHHYLKKGLWILARLCMVLKSSLNQMRIGLVVLTVADPPHVFVYFWVQILSLGVPVLKQKKQKQKLSPTPVQAKYRSFAHACADTICIWYILTKLQFSPPWAWPITLFCDNLNTTNMASNPVFHARTILLHSLIYISLLVLIARVQLVPSTDQITNVFTNGLSTQRFQLLQLNLVSSGSSNLLGSIKPP